MVVILKGPKPSMQLVLEKPHSRQHFGALVQRLAAQRPHDTFGELPLFLACGTLLDNQANWLEPSRHLEPDWACPRHGVLDIAPCQGLGVVLAMTWNESRHWATCYLHRMVQSTEVVVSCFSLSLVGLLCLHSSPAILLGATRQNNRALSLPLQASSLGLCIRDRRARSVVVRRKHLLQ